MTDRSRTRVGVVGCGNIWRFHADWYREAAATVVSGVHVAEPGREAFATEFELAVYEHPDLLYETADAVSITTAEKFHAEYAIRAPEADIDVLGKPPANTFEDAEGIAAAADRAAGFCMAESHTRFETAVEVLHEYIEVG